MVINLNMDLETRMANVYRQLGEPKLAEDRKAVSPDEFWQSMSMIATTNQAYINYENKNTNG